MFLLALWDGTITKNPLNKKSEEERSYILSDPTITVASLFDILVKYYLILYTEERKHKLC